MKWETKKIRDRKKEKEGKGEKITSKRIIMKKN